MMSVAGLTRRYGRLLALDEVSLEVGSGEVVGLLGANGAGKSTLLRTAAGLQPPDSGTVLLDAATTARLPTRSVARICTGKHVRYLGSANLFVNQRGQLRLVA